MSGCEEFIQVINAIKKNMLLKTSNQFVIENFQGRPEKRRSERQQYFETSVKVQGTW
jgi:hypothetical protein